MEEWMEIYYNTKDYVEQHSLQITSQGQKRKV